MGLGLGAAGKTAASQGLTAAQMWSMRRLGDPRPSPDGTRVAFVTREYNVETNHSVASLWVVSSSGGPPTRLTRAEVHDRSPRWLLDNRTLVFLSDRGGSTQIWAIRIDGGEPYRVTDWPLDVGNLAVSPDGARVAVSMEVFPECGAPACTAARMEAREKAAVQARVYSELLFRHWDAWDDGRRNHLFAASLRISAAGKVETGEPLDLMAGLNADSPTRPFGGGEEFAFSPDGTEITYAAKVLPGSEAAWRTDVDLYRVPVTGSAPPERITAANRAWDTMPAYSPDGRWLAWLAMARPGFESDRFHIVLQDRQAGTRRLLAESWDRSAGTMTWSSDSRTVVVTAQETGRQKIFAIDLAGDSVRPVVEQHRNAAVVAGSDNRIFFLQDSLTAPADLYSVSLQDGKVRRLTSFNADLLGQIVMSPPEDFWFTGAGGDRVHGWLLRPAGSRGPRRWPVAFLIHGGPQGAWLDQFHYRWNPQIYAAAGYMTLAINFHGSTGYGQAFTDSITRDWGGAPYQDLMIGLDQFVDREPGADADRMCALGASYGGYMINWIEGHTDRFHCLVNHDGLFDLSSMYFSTEELWFPEWEFGGTPTEHPALYKRWTPSRFVKNWKTPMLVFHGGKDFRVPESQGFSTFTALRRLDIPAKLVYFPGENHWVLRPANALFWHETVLDWLARWTGGGGKP